MARLTCLVCRVPIEDERFVLVQSGGHEAYCSQSCLVANVERRQRLHAKLRRRWLMRVSAVALVLIGANTMWHRYRMPQPQSISFEPPPFHPVVERPAPIYYGPAWPPTDQDWL